MQSRLNTAEEMAQAMISLAGEGNDDADGAALGGNSGDGSAGSGSKRDWALPAEKEIEMVQDDLDGDLDFANDMEEEIVHDLDLAYPDNLTAPLTFSLWEKEKPFYEALQKLYKARNTKVVIPVMQGDSFWI